MNKCLIIAVAFLTLVSCNGGQELPLATPIVSATAEPSATPFATAAMTATAVAEPTLEAPPTLTAVPTATPILPPLTISADNPLLRYNGRFDFTDPSSPIFDWPGVSISATFTGPSLTVLLESGQNLFDVTIDGQTTVLQTQPTETRYMLAQNLADGPHTVKIAKRTEPLVGRAAFYGFVLADGHTLLSPPEPSARRIEFIGDSITAGYGNEGATPTCYFTPETENALASFAGQTAAHFEADYSLLALSGLGVVRNFANTDALSEETALSYFTRAVALHLGSQWEFERWTPDIVVLNLGTNDFSTTPFPAQEDFVAGYTDLLLTVGRQYPEAQVLATAGPIMFADVWWYVETAVTLANQQLDGERFHYVPLENNLALSEVDYGCDWHPNVNGHQKMAAQLIPAIATIMDW